MVLEAANDVTDAGYSAVSQRAALNDDEQDGGLGHATGPARAAPGSGA
jgi:hypothetical protein